MTALEEIKKALEGVTPGPWELCAHLKHNDACSCGYRGVIYGPEPDGFAICQPGHEPAPEGQEGTEPPRYPRNVEIANMRYIAAVNPTAISELVSTLESLQRENAELRQAQTYTYIGRDGKSVLARDLEDRAEATEAEVKRLRDLLRFSHDTLWEINPSNYDHDDVCKLNDASVEVILAIAPELGETHSKSKEWWDERQALASTGGEHHAE